MTTRKRTARDVLNDPASWPETPEGFYPPNEIYLLAKFLNAVSGDNVLTVDFEAGGQLYRNLLEVGDGDEASMIAARLQPRRGDLLLEALETELA